MSIGMCLGIAARAQAAKPTLDECINANDKGASLRNAGKLQEARGQFAACAAPGCPKDIRNECEEQVKVTNAAVPTVIFEAKDGTGRDLDSVHVTVDGKPLPKVLDGTPLEFDPGAHQFIFTCDGQPALSRGFVFREGEKARREPIVLGAPTPPIWTSPLVTSPPGPITSKTPSKGDASAEPQPGMRPTTVAGIAAGGAGIAALGLGTAFGLMAKYQSDQQKTLCPNSLTCSADGHSQALSAHSKMTTDENISVVSFAAGGAAVVAGIVLLLLPGRSQEPRVTTQVHLAPSVAPGTAELTLRGEF